MRPSPLPPTTALLLTALTGVLSCPTSAQEGVPPPPGLVPEQMWPAPTAADWQKPVLIEWQRTWDDAVRLSQETKKPILVCVNMDGEIASEHYAGIRYRDPEICKLYEPYVCVIASVYRHNPRDYDEQGRRIPCPRFGGCTCGEHIAMEPVVYEKFLDGKRIAPRHIMVELDGSEVYDVFYTWDTASVFTAIGNGIQQRAIQAPPVVRGDKSLLEKVQSADSRDRTEVEAAFLTGDAEQKQALLKAALALGDKVPIELLRLAAMGLDPELGRQAREGMQKATDPGAVELIADTLRAQLTADERKHLVDALGKFAAGSTRARTLATAHKGLAGGSGAIDTARWSATIAGASYAAAIADQDAARLADSRDRALASQPKDPEKQLDVAEASLLQTLEAQPRSGPGAQRMAQRARQALLADAERLCDQAVANGAKGWRVPAIRALVSLLRDDPQTAHEFAITAAPQLPPEAPGRLAMELMALFAAARQEAIVSAVRGRQDWPSQWMTDVHAAYAVLGAHPLGTDGQVADHYDFLQFFGTPEADAVLDRGLVRFPNSARLHERLRTRVLVQQGPGELEAEYARRLQAADAPPTLPWFAGYATLVAAEHHRRQNRGADAVAAYGRGIELFGRYRTNTGSADGEHYVAMAHAGIARVRLLEGDLPATLAALRACFAAAPTAAASTDGLGTTAMQTADMLRQRAVEAQRDDLVQQLEALLQTLPSESFVVPEYERDQPNPRRRRRG